jgi:chromosome segregation ATPase
VEERISGSFETETESDDPSLLRQQLQEVLGRCERLEAEGSENERRLVAMRELLEQERLKTKELARQATMQIQLAARPPGGNSADASLRQENDRLNAEITELREQLAQSSFGEMQKYEQQLNEFRDQLETVQRELVQQEQDLQQKIKDTELQLSRERAEVLREKANLERLRIEIRHELEQAQREAEVLERMAPLQRLKQEMRVGQPKPEEATPSSLSERIRQFIKRMG